MGFRFEVHITAALKLFRLFSHLALVLHLHRFLFRLFLTLRFRFPDFLLFLLDAFFAASTYIVVLLLVAMLLVLLHFDFPFLFHQRLFLLTQSVLPLLRSAEVDALEVQSDRDDIDEEEADNGSVQLDQNLGPNFGQPDDEADENGGRHIDNFLEGHVLAFGPLEDAEEPFPALRDGYLATSRNSGNAEYKWTK